MTVFEISSLKLLEFDDINEMKLLSMFVEDFVMMHIPFRLSPSSLTLLFFVLFGYGNESELDSILFWCTDCQWI